MSSRVLRTAVAVAAFPAIAAVAPAAAHACTFAIVNGSAIAPAQALEQTADGVPLQVSYAGPATNRTVQFGIARLDTATLPPLGTVLPAEVGTVVETGELTYDAATNTWNGVANGSGWAQTPGEYVWQTTLNTYIPASAPPTSNGPSVAGCEFPAPWTHVTDGNWVHRITVLGTPALTAKAAKARDGRANVRGTITKAFPGKVRLSVACPGQRARTTFVPVKNGQWNRRINAKRGCKVEASVARRAGWVSSETSLRVR